MAKPKIVRIFNNNLCTKQMKTTKTTEGYVIGSKPITIAASDATNALELAFTADISETDNNGE